MFITNKKINHKTQFYHKKEDGIIKQIANNILNWSKAKKLHLCSLLVILAIANFSLYKYQENLTKPIQGYEKLIEEYNCKNNSSTEICQKLLIDQEKFKIQTDSTQNIFFRLFTDYSLKFLVSFGILFVIIPSLYSFHKNIHTGFIKEELMRMSYKDFLTKHFRETFKGAFILPIALILTFIGCFLISGHFDLSKGKMELAINYEYMKDFKFYIIFFINIFLHSIFFINIGLFFIKNFKSYIVTILLSFFACEIVFSKLIGSFLLDKLLGMNKMYDTLSLLNLYQYYGLNSYWHYLIFSIVIVIISSLIVFTSYKNKESLILQSEF